MRAKLSGHEPSFHMGRMGESGEQPEDSCPKRVTQGLDSR